MGKSNDKLFARKEEVIVVWQENEQFIRLDYFTVKGVYIGQRLLPLIPNPHDPDRENYLAEINEYRANNGRQA